MERTCKANWADGIRTNFLNHLKNKLVCIGMFASESIVFKQWVVMQIKRRATQKLRENPNIKLKDAYTASKLLRKN